VETNNTTAINYNGLGIGSNGTAIKYNGLRGIRSNVRTIRQRPGYKEQWDSKSSTRQRNATESGEKENYREDDMILK